ncbi:MAG: hypothetical protein HOW73_04150 [Polyangiaceae bacterium]|nr:hypothetical protein [Polyangiaceae bacterium]
MIEVQVFAALRAEIERSSDLDGVLRNAGITPRQWLRFERHWLTMLTDDAEGEHLSQRYLDAYYRVLAPTPPSEPQPAPAPPLAPAAPPAPAAPLAPPLPRPLYVPSYLAHSQTPAAQHIPAPASPQAASPVRAAMPSIPIGTQPLAAPAPHQRPVTLPFKQPPVGSATVLAEAPSASGRVLPFGSSRPAPSDVSPAPTEGRVANDRGGTGTLALDDHSGVPVTGPDVPDGLPKLSVDQYAWVVATLRKTAPADLPNMLGRLRLTTVTRTTLDALWKAHMARYPHVKQVFVHALATHLTRMSK